MNTSIVISPRERFTSIIDSLKSLFKTIPEDIPVIVVEGCSPESVRLELKKLKTERNYEWISLDYFITPQEARNIGFSKVDTEYVVLTDNDIHYEDGWLEALLSNAKTNNSSLVSPLICIGPPEAKMIHHAGGDLVIRNRKNKPHVTEEHRLMNRQVSDLDDTNAPIENEIVESHCFLARSEYIREIGPFDERLITREQIDFGLRAKFYGAKVTFEKASIVTYMAKIPFLEIDLPYMVFRWSDNLAIQSLEAFSDTWGITTDAKRVLNDWIRMHRLRAFQSAFPEEVARLGLSRFKSDFVLKREKEYILTAFKTRISYVLPARPYTLAPDMVTSFFKKHNQIKLKYSAKQTVKNILRQAYSTVRQSYRGMNIFEKYSQLKVNDSLADPRVDIPKRPLIIGGMATMPTRQHSLWVAIESILPQLDRLYLFFDRFEEIPVIRHPKIITLSSQIFGDHRANGKFLGLLMSQDDHYYFSIDDDIVYPSDYVQKMISFLNKHNDEIAISVHGSKLNTDFNNYMDDRKVYFRSKGFYTAKEVDVLGTDTTVFHTSKVNFDVRKWKYRNVVDLLFAQECKARSIRRIVTPRNTNWIKCIETSQPDSIYTALKKDDSLQTKIAKELMGISS